MSNNNNDGSGDELRARVMQRLNTNVERGLTRGRAHMSVINALKGCLPELLAESPDYVEWELRSTGRVLEIVATGGAVAARVELVGVSNPRELVVGYGNHHATIDLAPLLARHTGPITEHDIVDGLLQSGAMTEVVKALKGGRRPEPTVAALATGNDLVSRFAASGFLEHASGDRLALLENQLTPGAAAPAPAPTADVASPVGPSDQESDPTRQRGSQGP